MAFTSVDDFQAALNACVSVRDWETLTESIQIPEVMVPMADTSAGTGKLCILGHLGLVFIWSCFLSCLLFLLFYVSLRNLCSGTCRKIPNGLCEVDRVDSRRN